MNDHWSVLGLSPGASPSEVRQAFRSKARLWHPDRGGDPERFHALSQAYDRAMRFQDHPTEVKETKKARSSKPVSSEAPKEKREPTLEDFLQWRRQQQPRRAARRAATPRPGGRGSAGTMPSRSSSEGRVHRGKRLRQAVQQAESPELEAAWQREVDMETFQRQRNKPEKGSRSPSSIKDERVGYRSVKSASGTLTVPIFQSADGARYYMSPLTSQRVASP